MACQEACQAVRRPAKLSGGLSGGLPSCQEVCQEGCQAVRKPVGTSGGPVTRAAWLSGGLSGRQKAFQEGCQAVRRPVRSRLSAPRAVRRPEWLRPQFSRVFSSPQSPASPPGAIRRPARNAARLSEGLSGRQGALSGGLLSCQEACQDRRQAVRRPKRPDPRDIRPVQRLQQSGTQRNSTATQPQLSRNPGPVRGQNCLSAKPWD